MVSLLNEIKQKEKYNRHECTNSRKYNILVNSCIRGIKIKFMARIIKSALIQMSLPKTEGEGTIEEIKEAMVQKHIPLIEEDEKYVHKYLPLNPEPD